MNPYPPIEAFFRVGKSLKSHGTNGQLRLSVEEGLKNYIKQDSYLFFDVNGSRVPYKVKTVDDAAHFVVALADVQDKNASDAIAGSEIWIPLQWVKPQHVKSPKNIGDKWDRYVIITQDEIHFPILRVEEYPQQLMAIVDLKGKEILIPLNDQLMTEIDRKNRQIRMQIPEGLLEL